MRQTISLDSFTMMNATYTKQSFTSKTIAEVLGYFSIKYNVKFQIGKEYKSEWHKFNELTQMLQPQIDKLSISNLTSEYSLLKYQVAIHGIYIERLLNKRWKLTNENIDEEETIMKSILSFFYDWRMEILLSNAKYAVTSKEGERYFIAKKNIPEYAFSCFWVHWVC